MGNKPTNGRLEAMLEKLNARLLEQANAKLETVLHRVGRLADPVQCAAALGRRQCRPDRHRHRLAVRLGKRRKGRLPAAVGGHAQGQRPQDLGAGRRRRPLGSHQARRRQDLLHARGQLHPVHQPRLLLPRRLGQGGWLRERRDHQVRGLHQVLRVGQGQQARRLSVGRRRRQRGRR